MKLSKREMKLIEEALSAIEKENIENDYYDAEDQDLTEEKQELIKEIENKNKFQKNKKRANRFNSEARLAFRQWRKMSGF